MVIKKSISFKSLKLIFIGLLLGVLVVINFYVINKVVSGTDQARHQEKNIVIFH